MEEERGPSRVERQLRPGGDGGRPPVAKNLVFAGNHETLRLRLRVTKSAGLNEPHPYLCPIIYGAAFSKMRAGPI